MLCYVMFVIWNASVQSRDSHPESSEVGGVVAETSQMSVWSVHFRAAIGAPILNTVVPENTGEVVQIFTVWDLKQDVQV